MHGPLRQPGTQSTSTREPIGRRTYSSKMRAFAAFIPLVESGVAIYMTT